jgi:hypothetical protein
MRHSTLGGAVIVVAIVAACIFGGVAVREFNYASGHPYAYGPAKVIAWGGVAGVVVSVGVGLLGYALTQFSSWRS